MSPVGYISLDQRRANRNLYQNAMDVEEVLLDASNIPAFNRERLEGKRERPLAKRSVRTVWYIFLVIMVVLMQ